MANKELRWRFRGSVANKGLGANSGEWLVTELEGQPSPLHWMEKSAETLDGKGVAGTPLRKRVRNCMKAKGLDGNTPTGEY